MPVTRRALLALPLLAAPGLVSGLVSGLAPGLAKAAGYPDRAIRLICPFAPGGNADVVSRILSAPLTELLGQPVVVENRAGAGGTVGAIQAARARPDGYTLMLGSNGPLSVSPTIQPNLGYDPQKDFAPIGLACRTPLTIVVKKGLAPRTLGEFMDYVRARPGAVSVGSSGIGSTSHLALETLNTLTGLQLQHVPYGSGGAMAPDLVAGNIDAAITEISTSLPLHRDGAVRILALASAGRSVLAPDIPTVEEAGVPGFREAAFIGLVLPANPPPEVLARLVAALGTVLAQPATRRRFNDTGSEVAEPAEQTPAGFAAFLEAELARTRTAATRAGLRAG